MPKDLVIDKLAKSQKPFNPNDDAEPLNVLAKLPLPVYLTTNYDDLLFAGIRHHGQAWGRIPAFEICKWNESPSIQPDLFERGSNFKPSVQAPRRKAWSFCRWLGWASRCCRRFHSIKYETCARSAL
jgi:hypothetical protein